MPRENPEALLQGRKENFWSLKILWPLKKKAAGGYNGQGKKMLGIKKEPFGKCRKVSVVIDGIKNAFENGCVFNQ